jgi:hypothetical protein
VDTWQWSGSGWSQVATAGPLGRTNTALGALGSTLVLFGGFNGVDTTLSSKWLGDTWVWNGSVWITIGVAAAPQPRDNHAMATLGNKVVMFGGQGGGGPALGDTWVWDGSAWTSPANGGPAARDNYAMATLGNTVVMFGGRDNAHHYLGDTWTWDGSSWTLMVPTNAPSARQCAAMAPLGNKLVLFGGLNGGNGGDHQGVWLDDTWEWDGSTWTLVSATSSPSSRAYFGLAAANATVLFFGGEGSNNTYQGDTWLLSGTTWIPASGSSSPGARVSPAVSSFGFQ